MTKNFNYKELNKKFERRGSYWSLETYTDGLQEGTLGDVAFTNKGELEQFLKDKGYQQISINCKNGKHISKRKSGVWAESYEEHENGNFIHVCERSMWGKLKVKK